MAAANRIGAGSVLVNGSGANKKNRLHAQLLRALDVVMITVANMQDLFDRNAHLASCVFEHRAMRLRVPDLVGEGIAIEMPGKVVAGDQLAQATPGGDDGVRNDASAVALVDFGERFDDAGNEVWTDFHLHLFMSAHQ